MWTIVSVILNVLSEDPSASTSSGALWALQVAWSTRSLDLPVCVTVHDTIFENRQRVNKTAYTITKRFKTVCVQQCTTQNRKIKPAPIVSNKNGTGKLCKPHHTIM
ncbi:hypothetical protein DPMN_039458 [Dreissena polymorpha]|uniref:Uncharacterized protein n=1 Tax=Dreissena polymorpha TaxID=45954 RepID=A0A9D4CUU8_DREPO|nr:hypothetical protein DPMN_039458 [Dreissena polymorpha]